MKKLIESLEESGDRIKNRDALLLALIIMGLLASIAGIVVVLRMIAVAVVLLSRFIPFYIVFPVFILLFIFSTIKVAWRFL